eukprot:Hpha_TRINITY_DN10922_c1_g1::TRINITY_DN10922_c1_g1_i1::g.26803::m.26803
MSGGFKCGECGLAVRSASELPRGRAPPNADSSGVVWLEDSWAVPDPFTDVQGVALRVGAPCARCSTPVCAAAPCSIYYGRRFCRSCVTVNAHLFPDELSAELNRMCGGTKPKQ